MSRNKGAAAEREVFKMLTDELGFVVRRNVDQARAGGADGIDIPGIAVEVKRRESLSVPSWWRQACEQAIQMQGRLPVLFYRRSREKWQAVVPATRAEWSPVRVDWESAMQFIRENMGAA